MYPYETEKMVPDFAFSLAAAAKQAIEHALPYLRGDFPPLGQFNFDIGFDDELCIVTMTFKDSGIPAGGKMKPDEFSKLKAAVGSARTQETLRAVAELKSRFGWDRFMLALDVTDGKVDWHEATANLNEWLNGEPLQRALQHNVDRVKSAIPSPPQYSLAAVQKAMWVLECEETMRQGTAFALEGYGAITNEHVVDGAKALLAFRPEDPTKKYPVNVLAKNAALDLAIISIEGQALIPSLAPSSAEVAPMDHIAVCGFPNYRLGDTGVLVPGLVVGTRPKSGVHRLLTNASIVTGMSGGPVLGADGNVVGVCVSGADSFTNASDTEDHSIIPISALDLLELKA